MALFSSSLVRFQPLLSAAHVLLTLAAAALSAACLNAETLPQAYQRAQHTYETARADYLSATNKADLASQLAHACFDFAELSTSSQKRAALAQEGIAAARAAIQIAPDRGAGHLYLGLNLGEFARTKMLGALSLLRQMERALLRAVELDPQIDHAAADRSLGLLYLEAPGWPASVGSKRKAREHLTRAVSIASDYPDNHLSLLEAYVKWEDDALPQAIRTYRNLLPKARKKYSGPEWEQAWHDWDERWRIILTASETEP